MADRITVEERSVNMSRIRGRDTSIELKVRSYLFSKGFRFRKNDRRYPGTPDIVLPKYRTVIFINGCFWHRHEGCRYATTPKSNVEFWNAKFERNVANDRKHRLMLENMGWQVIVLWECEIRKEFDSLMEKTVLQIRSAVPATRK